MSEAMSKEEAISTLKAIQMDYCEKAIRAAGIAAAAYERNLTALDMAIKSLKGDQQ